MSHPMSDSEHAYTIFFRLCRMFVDDDTSPASAALRSPEPVIAHAAGNALQSYRSRLLPDFLTTGIETRRRLAQAGIKYQVALPAARAFFNPQSPYPGLIAIRRAESETP